MSTDQGASPAFIALSCIGFIATAVGTSVVHAQSTPPKGGEDKAVELQGVTVTDTAIDDGLKVERVESPKATRALLDTPQTISVIGNQTIRQQNLLTLRDALATLPGITFGAGEGGGGYGDSINLRGYSANNDLTIDGVRDSAQYSRSETFNVEQIEVYNGANSVFNGSGSVGGTINIVQKTPKAQDLVVLGAGVGTDNYYRATIDANKRIDDLAAVRLNAVFHRNDAPGRDVEKFKRWGIAPSIVVGLDTPTRATFSYVHQHDNNIPQYGVPYYAIAGGLIPGADREGYYGFRNVDEQKSTLNQGTIKLEHDITDKISIRNLTRYQNIKQTTIVDPPQGTYCLAATNLTPTGVSCRVNIAPTGSAAANVTVPPGFYLPTGPRGNLRRSRNQLAYNQLDLRAVFDTAGLEHTLVLGGALTWERYHLDTGNVLRNANGSNPFGGTAIGAHLPYLNIADPSSIVVGPTLPGASYGSNVYTGPLNYIRSALSDSELHNYAAYLFDTIKLSPMFELNGGIRYETNKTRFRGDTVSITPATLGAVTTGPTFRNQENLFSYRFGALFKPVPNASIYAAYGNARTPSTSTVNGGCSAATCATAPETAKNYEIGAKIDLFDARLQLTAAAFRNERTNFKVATNDIQNPTIQVLDGQQRVDGIALGATGNITEAWAIFANYTYLDSKILQSVSDFCLANPTSANCVTAIPGASAPGEVIVQTPKHSGSLFTTYALPFGLQLGYGLTYQGSFALSNNSSAFVGGAPPRSDDYLTHRLFASYALTEGLTAQINVQNVTNEKYFTGIRNNGWANPGAARSATLTVYYSF